MRTNSGNAILSLVLQAAPARATFTSVILRKQGTEKGGKVYGDDLVHAVVVTGFRYGKLVERSREALQALKGTEAQIAESLANADAWDGRGKNAAKVRVTEAHVRQALAELEESFATTLDPAAESQSTTEHVYEPLVVDGEEVRGGRVYMCAKRRAPKCHCRDCTGDVKAPKAGTIYLQGLAIGSKVIEPSANGPAPAPKSNPVTVAKNYIRGKLPVARYVSYRLEGDFLLKVGGTAAVKVDEDGVHLSQDLALLLTAV